MRVSTSCQGTDWAVNLRLDPEEELLALGQWDIPIQLTVDHARVQLPRPVDPHPDLIALAALLVVGPWVARQLTIDVPVSQTMANAANEAFGIKLGPVDSQLEKRSPGTHATMAYSGGPDSMAADLLIPQPLSYHHFVRASHPAVPNRASHFRTDLILSRVEKVRDGGTRDVSITRSDIEFVAARPFPTFPYWVSMAIGPVLMADADDLGAVVFGRHIGGSYVHSGQRFDPVADHDFELRTLFAGAGLDLTVPTSGVTEVGTMRLARDHPLAELAISCQLTDRPGGCQSCEKCLRKELVNAYLEGRPPTRPVLSWAESDPKLRRRFDEFRTTPMPHIYAFLSSRLEGLEGTFLREWLSTLHQPLEATEWVQHHYPRGVEDWVPARWRPGAREMLDRRLGAMGPRDVAMVESWPPPLVGEGRQMALSPGRE
jgi:hypothetical protein